MRSFSIILFTTVTCLAAITNGQNYIRLSRSDQNLNLARNTHFDQKQEDGVPENMELINQLKSPKASVPQDLLEPFPPQRKRYGGYYYDDFIDLPYPTLKAARKRTNYVRLAKKGANYVRLAKKEDNLGKFSDLYDNIQYDEM